MYANIDEEFENFVKLNYHKLTENERNICKQLGISVPN